MHRLKHHTDQAFSYSLCVCISKECCVVILQLETCSEMVLSSGSSTQNVNSSSISSPNQREINFSKAQIYHPVDEDFYLMPRPMVMTVASSPVEHLKISSLALLIRHICI